MASALVHRIVPGTACRLSSIVNGLVGISECITTSLPQRR